MIVDVHTHIFPAEVAADRARYLAQDETFAELYASDKAQLASADDLLASMNTSHVDVSVALGFAWRDLEACVRHNDYLLDAAARSDGRIVAFCTLPLASGINEIEAEMRRCVNGGARGFGELRPDNLGFDLKSDAGKRVGELARELDAALLFHASEPVGHAYPGKRGGALRPLYEFIVAHPDVRVIAAHWGGGLPFYALMPEVKEALRNVCFDTAGTSLLYTPEIYARAIDLVGAESILFGSDFPLLSQARSRERIEETGLDDTTRAAILGDNAARFLKLA